MLQRPAGWLRCARGRPLRSIQSHSCQTVIQCSIHMMPSIHPSIHPEPGYRPMNPSRLGTCTRLLLAYVPLYYVNLPVDPVRCSGTYSRPTGGRRRAVAQPTSSPIGTPGHWRRRVHVSTLWMVTRIGTPAPSPLLPPPPPLEYISWKHLSFYTLHEHSWKLNLSTLPRARKEVY